MQDACIVHGLSESDCASKGGTIVERAKSQGQCTQRKACFDKNMNMITAVGAAQCQVCAMVCARRSTPAVCYRFDRSCAIRR